MIILTILRERIETNQVYKSFKFKSGVPMYNLWMPHS